MSMECSLSNHEKVGKAGKNSDESNIRGSYRMMLPNIERKRAVLVQ